MSYVRLDDGLWRHRKVGGCSLEAVGLFTLLLSQAGDYGTDRVERAAVEQLARSRAKGRRLAGELTDAGLLEDDGDGWRIHDLLEHNPGLKGRVEISAARSAAGKRGAQARWRDSKPDGKATVSHALANGNGMANEQQTDATTDHLPPTALVVATDPETHVLQQLTERAGAANGRLITGWLNRLPKRPPTKFIGQVTQQVDALLADGTDPDVIEAALGLLAENSRLGAGVLPSLVNQVLNPTVSTRRDGLDPIRAALHRHGAAS